MQWLISFSWPAESPRASVTAMVLSSLCWRPESVGNLGNAVFPDIRRVLHRFYGSIWGWILQDKGLPQRLSGKESTFNAGDAGSITVWGRSPGGGHGCTGNPVQYSCWGIPCTEEPGRIQSMGSQRVEHNWSNLAHTHTEINTLSITVEITGFNDSWHWIQVRGQFVSVLYQLKKKRILETKSGLGTQTIKQFTLVEKVVYLKFY